MDYKQAISSLIDGWIAANAAGADVSAEQYIETPPSPAMGDWAFPCFRLSKALRAAPDAIARRMQAELALPPFVERVEAAGGYANFFLNTKLFARETLEAISASSGRYGASAMGADKTVVLDYSSINITKRFHIGHLSTTVIGHALKRIFEHLGYTCVGVNHLGDWGTQFGKMIYAFKRWSSEEELERGGIQHMEALYVRFHNESAGDPSMETEARRWFKRMEEGDAEALGTYELFKRITLEYAEGVYKQLGVTFESYAGEAFYEDKMQRVIDELTEKGLLVESEGARIVDLEPWGMPPCIILKSDGATIYHTRDIAAALYRMDTYNFDRCLYVVAYQQDLHFRQLFKVIELMGYEWAQHMEHISYGMVSFEGQAMATRKGHIVYLDELLERAVEKARAIIDEKSPDLPDKEAVAKQVGIGAVVFQTLSNNRIKDIDFWWDRALSFEGETGPYMQYTHARCCSVLGKARDAGYGCETPASYDALSSGEALEVIRLLARFPARVLEAADRREPSIITRHLMDIAQAYNHFYYECRILDDDADTRAARLELTRAVRDVTKTGLYLIGVEAPDRM